MGAGNHITQNMMLFVFKDELWVTSLKTGMLMGKYHLEMGFSHGIWNQVFFETHFKNLIDSIFAYNSVLKPESMDSKELKLFSFETN